MRCTICDQPVAMLQEGKCHNCTPSGIKLVHLIVCVLMLAGIVLAGWGGK